MPLKCLDGEQEIYAFDITSDEAWDALRRANSEQRSLRMPCCGAGVVLRTSKLGTRHFAHARRGPCQSAPETAEHLLAKMAVIEAVKTTEWLALPEQSGQTPNGDAWRADVLATKGKVKVAIEIQWSRQDSNETDRRQRRYAEAGVRGLWLFRQPDFPTRKEIPSFRLVLDVETRSIDVLIPSVDYDPRWVSAAKDESRLWAQRIPLKQFVVGALQGRLRFAPALGQRMPLVVNATLITCWRCKQETRVVMGLTFAASRLFPGLCDIHTTIYDMDERLPDGASAVMELLPARLLAAHGIGAIRPRRSKSATYLSNGCIHCDALQGRFFDHEFAFEGSPTFETEGVFKKEWMPRLANARPYVYRWWFGFDESGQ